MRRSTAVVAPRSPSLALHDLEVVEDRDDLVPGGYLDGVALTGTDLAGHRLVDLVVQECRWSGVDLDGTDLRGARLVGCELSSLGAATLAAARSRWRECEVADSRLGTVDLSGAEVECLAVRRCKIGYLNLRGAVLSDLSFEGCTVEEVDLTDATVRRLAFTGCRVDVVDLAVASAQDLDLRGSDVAALDGLRSLDGVVLDEDQARWFGPLLATTLGGRVL